MGRESILAKVKLFIGYLGWRIYLWGQFDGDEDRWHREKDREVIDRYPYTCPECDGAGGEHYAVAQAGDQTMEEWADCPRCGGLGRTEAEPPEEVREAWS